LRQSARDLEQAEDSLRAGRHEWACFAAHQAAKKAAKALHLHLGQEAWGHAVAKILSELGTHCAVPQHLIEKGRVLDNFNVPSRYPDGHVEGAPFEHYGPIQSKEALDFAREIVEFTRVHMA
jgi:HEPN domain-containing protein